MNYAQALLSGTPEAATTATSMEKFLEKFAHTNMIDPTIRKQLQILDFQRFLAEYRRLPEPLQSTALPEPYRKPFLRFVNLGQKFMLEEIARTTKRLQKDRTPTVTRISTQVALVPKYV